MALQLPELENPLFKHSEEFDQGGGKVRIGQATVVVALDGTGDTDDIQEGIDMLPKDGGAVYIKEGTYKTADIITKVDNTFLIGASHATIISATGGVQGYAIRINHNNFTIEKINLKSTGIDSSNTAINLHTGKNCTIRNNYFTGFATNSIHISGNSTATTSQNLITGNFIVNSTAGSRGIFLGTGQGNVEDCMIVNNYIEGINGEGIKIHASSGNYTMNRILVMGNIVKDCAGDGIQLDKSASGAVNNCVVANNISYNNDRGINIVNAAVSKTLITGNSAYGNTTAQIADAGTNTLPNGAMGTTNLQLDDLNIII